LVRQGLVLIRVVAASQVVCPAELLIFLFLGEFCLMLQDVYPLALFFLNSKMTANFLQVRVAQSKGDIQNGGRMPSFSSALS
jgi:hypothetical protein